MSERLQHTAISTRELMLRRYDDGLHHKHDKNHTLYRQHCRSHPVKQRANGLDAEREINCSTGLVREMRLRQYKNKICKTRCH